MSDLVKVTAHKLMCSHSSNIKKNQVWYSDSYFFALNTCDYMFVYKALIISLGNFRQKIISSKFGKKFIENKVIYFSWWNYFYICLTCSARLSNLMVESINQSTQILTYRNNHSEVLIISLLIWIWFKQIPYLWCYSL